MGGIEEDVLNPLSPKGELRPKTFKELIKILE
jgi:hypothetical protein